MKRKTVKRVLALFMAAAVTLGSGMIPGSQTTVKAAAMDDALIASFNFDNDVQASGAIVGGGAKATGSYTLVDSFAGGGKALHLDAGAAQFLTLTKENGSSLLNGVTEMTISYEAKHDRNDTNWVFYGAKSADAPGFGTEVYFGLIQNGGTLTVERYNNTNGRPVNASYAVGNDWSHVTIVASTSDTAIYVNGEEVSRVGSSYALKDIFGTNGIAQIGKANWGGGEYSTMSIDNFKIYNKALTASEVAADFSQYAVSADVQALTIPTETNRSLDLPTTGKSGLTKISWKSGNTSVMANDGTVTRPSSDTNVKLTATISANGVSLTKDFTVKVLKKDTAADLQLYKEELTLNAGFVAADLELPAKLGDAALTWKSSDTSAVAANGKVTRGSSNKDVTLTATITVDGQSVTKDLAVTVLAKGQDVVTYISNAPATGQNGGMKIAAQSADGYEALNKNQPILYSAQGVRAYGATNIFRKADGSFGVIASDGGSNGNVVLYDSKDLIRFTNERLVSLSGISSITNLTCVYDKTEKEYKLFVQDKAATYLLTSTNLRSFSGLQNADYDFAEVTGVPSDAVVYTNTALTQKEFDALLAKFKNPYNTKVTFPKMDDITIAPGEDLELPESAEAEYSDGTVRTLGIEWSKSDLAAVNAGRPGTYEINGVVGGASKCTDADSPLILERADPFVTYNEDDGYYYFTSSYPMVGSGDPEGYDRLILRRAKTIKGLADSEEVVIWDESEVNGFGRFIWAPELHKIGDYWYYLSTAALEEGGTSFNIRPFMLKCENPDDMMNPDSWGEPVRVKAMAGQESTCVNAMSLDMTYFEAGGTHYLAWADFTQNGRSCMYIATIDPDNPTQMTSKVSIITSPEYSWERVGPWVNEGPSVIKNDGMVHMAFSASGTGMEYCVGVLSADENDDLLNVNNWTKTAYPIMTSGDFDDAVSGPGHNSFTIDEYGNPIIVYHARPTYTHTTAGGVHNGDPLVDPCRHCYLKPVYFGVDGAPILNMTEDEYVAEEYRNVTVKVTVSGEVEENKPVLEYTFDEEFKKGTAKDSAGNNDADLTKNAVYVQDKEYGQVLYLDGGTEVGGSNSYLEFPTGIFDGMDSMTISMDVNEVTRKGNYFTFTIGQDTNRYLFLKTDPTHMKLAITTSSYMNEKIAETNFVYPNNSRTWINVKMVITPTTISLYQDGELLVQNLNTGISISDLGSNLKAYLGRSFYSGDKYFRGYFDNVKVYDYAMTASEVKTMTEQEAADRAAAMSDVNYVADTFEIPNMDNVRGNITLPSDINGVKVTWTSSNEDVISTENVENDDYDTTPAGVVTRQEVDTVVKLTAKFEKDGAAVTKTYNVTVKAEAKEVTEDDYYGYLFVRFTGSEANGNEEQTYFSISTDGLNWEDLNNSQPVLTSTLGESGLRDHFIARTPEGDKFYMIATDLSIYHGEWAWMDAGGSGSHSIMVWESEDLVNWSEPWLAEIAPENAGCTWAPEFIYDDVTGEFVVFWSATTLEVDARENVTQEYENHTIYYAKTRDFRTFTDAEVYHSGGKRADGTPIKMIDSTMIQHDGIYYRYTKNEMNGTILIDKCDTVLGDFTDIPSNDLSVALPNAQGAVEGPIIFKLNERNEDGEEQWCLMVDRFARGQGYYPLITSDLESGEFRLLSDSEYSFPTKFRHGYVMPITRSEYGMLQAKWGDGDFFDKYALEEAIKDAKALKAENYTEESYAVLEDAIKDAEADLKSVRDMDDVVEAVETLKAAVDQLEPAKLGLPYEDVTEADWFYDDVYYNYYAGTMTGMDETHFGPYGQLSRAQFALMLYRIEGEPTVTTTKSFGDISGDEWYGKAVLWAAEAGIVGGYLDGNFGPVDNITREQMALMMYRYAKYLGKDVTADGDYSSFKDATSVSEFATEAMKWAVGKGIITGKENGTMIDPQGNTARCEAAAILQRFMTK